MIELMLLATLVGSLTLAIVVVMSDSKRLESRLFASIAACFGLWSLSIVLFMITTDANLALAYSKLFYAGSVIFTPLLATFAILYPRGRLVPLLLRRIMIGGAVGFATVIVVQDHFIIQELVRYDDGWRAVINQPGYMIFSGYFVFYFMIAIGAVLHKFFSYHGVERMRASYYAFGVLATSIPGFIADLILPYFGDYHYIWIGPVASVAFLVMSGYSITKHRMLDVKVFLAKAALYGIVVLVASGVYAAAIYVLTTVLLGQEVSPSVQFAANVAASLLVAFSLPPIRVGAEWFLNLFLHFQRYDSQELINQITTLCVEITDLKVLVESVLEKTKNALNPKFIAVLFCDTEHDDIVLGKLPARLRDLDTLERAARRQDAACCGKVLSLKTPSQQIGYLVIGNEADGRIYRDEDEKVLSVITDELSVSVQNIFRLEEIRTFARTLEKEVNNATRELRESNDRLLAIDATKDEFVGMASHQLRTPLTSVKGYLSMVLEGDAGEITKSQRQLLEEAYMSSERMVHLISDFLNVSRLQTGKFTIERRAVDIGQIVDQEVEGMRQIARSHGIALSFRRPSRLPLLYLDENKIRQVVMNFIDNAIYYSPDATQVTVTLEVADGSVVFRVVDEGIGVPRDVQKKLFTKFFRAENARKQRPDGTGIGLYLSKRIIDGHHGRLIFESPEGGGSVFGFRLPVKRLSVAPSQAERSEKGLE